MSPASLSPLRPRCKQVSRESLDLSSGDSGGRERGGEEGKGHRGPLSLPSYPPSPLPPVAFKRMGLTSGSAGKSWWRSGVAPRASERESESPGGDKIKTPSKSIQLHDSCGAPEPLALRQRLASPPPLPLRTRGSSPPPPNPLLLRKDSYSRSDVRPSAFDTVPLAAVLQESQMPVRQVAGCRNT
ncbi:uncharacterized protein LOC125025957 [Penaeus chinensis]|uniref:uncharacterized protein LOC125025957 n=1 Tax=Penaeus chinensis TaxID=139456 RepID=UPI001FB7831A|nr:uncharacterized protein LOC125025957 [Penaeus chinensis]